MAEVVTRLLLSRLFLVDDEPGVFAQITRVLAEHRIGLASVIQREAWQGTEPPKWLAAHLCGRPEAALASAEQQLARLSSTRAVQARIRVEAHQ